MPSYLDYLKPQFKQTNPFQSNQSTVNYLDYLKPEFQNRNPFQQTPLGPVLPTNQQNQPAQQITPISQIEPIDIPNTFNAEDLNQNTTLRTPSGLTEADAVALSQRQAMGGFQSAFDQLNEQIQSILNQQTTPLEEERSGLTGQLKSALDRLTGKEQKQTQLLDELGVNANVKELQNIMSQIAQANASLQAGLTAEAGRVAPMELITGRQAQLQAQGLAKIGGLTSIAQALQGNISLAQQTAQQAVDLEFAPAEREIATIREFLDINADNLTREEKKRAEQLQISLDERQRLLDEQKIDREGILDIAIEAAKNGADSETLNNILNSNDVQNALINGQGFLREQTEITPPTSYREYQFAGGLEGTGKSYIEWLGNQSGLSPKVQSAVDTLAKSFDTSPIVKDFVDVQNKRFSVQNILESGVGGPGDLAIVFEFMKALDPTSVVRESEYEAASKSGNIFKGAFARFNGYLKPEGGFLPPEVKQSFLDIMNIKFDAKAQQYDNLFNEFSRKINQKTGDDNGSDYLTQYKFDFSSPSEELNLEPVDIEKYIGNSNLLRTERPELIPLVDELIKEARAGNLGYSINDPNFDRLFLEDLNDLITPDFNNVDSDTNPAIQDLTIGNKQIKVAGTIANRLKRADADFFRATGQHLQINQSFRSKEQQAELYRRSQAGEIGRAAPPGKSFHEKGLAVDITNWKEAEPYLRKYGLINALPDDRGHFSFGEFT